MRLLLPQEVTMLGLIFGTVCLIALFRVLRRSGYGRFAHDGPGCGYAPFAGWRRGFGGPRTWLRSIFERLETTPAQEKAILSALTDLRGSRSVLREEAQRTRVDVRDALAGGLIDDSRLEETFARHDRLLAQLRVSFVETMKQISEVLDERQRKQLAAILEGSGWRGSGMRWGDAYPNVWA
jgi:Spy/CpxP family protein refolding chaperone